ncbi:MAG: glycosyl transferase [Chloroflexi bacterium]|nr:glycosyl transferase [Chloroflexota bacterium]
MDDTTFTVLSKLKLPNTRLIPLERFEDDALRGVRQNRTLAEYCWTCTAPLLLHVMEREPQAGCIAYLDADLFFFNDPQPIYDELADNSILIIPHRFSPEYQAWEQTSGIYNVSMIVFRDDRAGRECLNWWKAQCLAACYLDPATGQCGDQKYLDDWTIRFRNVSVLQHKGGGLAPWNISNYDLHASADSTWVNDDELIFYHFHSLQIVNRQILGLRPYLASKGYKFTQQQRRLVYAPYARALGNAIQRAGQAHYGFAHGYAPFHWRDVLRAFRLGNLVLA